MKIKPRSILICFMTVLMLVQMCKPLSALASIDKIPVAITFNADVWGAQEELVNVLNVLDEHDIRATFFFLGKYAELEPEALRLVFSRGHEIGARSYDHSRRLIDIDENEQKADIERTVNLIVSAIGQRPIGFASPGYFYNNETLNVLKNLGFVYDRSARGALHIPNDRSYWRWQNETKRSINYVGVFSNQRPFIHDQGVYEFPITYSLDYSSFNLTSGLNPIWWEKINGTDIILSDATWFEELRWNQSRCLDLLKYGLRQQIEFKMPLVVSLAPHIIGRVEWIWVLEEFIDFALKNNVVFLTLNELLNWWFGGSCVRMVKQISKQTTIVGEDVNILIHIYVLKGEIYNVTVTDEFDGLLRSVSSGGQIVGNKLVWHFDKLNDNFTISYTMNPQYSSFLTQGVTLKYMTISRHLSFFATINSDDLISIIRSNPVELYVQINPLLFWMAILLVIILIISASQVLYRRIKLVQGADFRRI
ncbi:MAG: polysaccharide deacetylase family protein [Candidatus Bathyarchaeia archaeon]